MNKNYIKMCRKAKEIQELWEPKPGDLFYEEYSEKDKKFSKEHWPDADDHNGSFHHVSDSLDFMNDSDNRYSNQLKESCSWYPRQEYLEKITSDKLGLTTFGLTEVFYNYFKEKCAIPTINRLNANENLTTTWTHFFMEICYGKRWDSEKEEWTFI
jgi:hypothetical protein